MSMRWNDSQASTLLAILDYLVPANAQRGISGAGDTEVLAFISVCADDDEDLFQQISELLQHAGTATGEFCENTIRSLQHHAPDAFAALLRVTYMAYYSRAATRAQLGLSASPTQPLGHPVPAETPEFIDSLVAPVKRRGPCYRKG